MFFRDQGGKLARFGVVGEEFGGGDFEEPAVKAQGAVSEAVLHAGIAVEVVEGVENIFLGGGGAAGFVIVEVMVFLFQGVEHGRGELEPITEVRRGIADRRMAEKGVNGAALGVAADDDVVHAQIIHGKFEIGRASCRERVCAIV